MSLRLGLITVAIAVTTACGGRGYNPQGQNQDTDGDTGVIVYEECPEEVQGFNIEGTAIDLASNDPAAEGLCAHAVDPSAALIGGDPEILATGLVRADGTFSLCGIETDSSIGILMLIDDCESDDTDAADTVIASASGIATEDYENLGDGDVIGDRTAYSITSDYSATLETSLDTAGASKDLVDGALLGFIVTSDRLPIDGGTVTCDSCTDFVVYYADADAKDGLFTTGGDMNTASSADAQAFYVIPGAAIKTYNAAADGMTFSSRLAGSMPGWAVFVSWVAE